MTTNDEFLDSQTDLSVQPGNVPRNLKDHSCRDLLCIPLLRSIESTHPFFSRLELTEFPKIDASDESSASDNDDDDEHLSNSIGSLSIDGSSLNTTANTTSGLSHVQATSDYESFADCMRPSPALAAANHRLAESLTLDHRTSSLPSSVRVNGEGSSSSQTISHRQRKHGTSAAAFAKTGKPTVASTLNRVTTNNETPLLSHLLGTHTLNSDSH